MGKPIIFILKNLLKNNSIRVDENELEFQLMSHPSYPSLHSITGVLDHFNIKNYALEVPRESGTIELLPKYFLANIKSSGFNGFALVHNQKLNLEVTFDNEKKATMTTNTFLEIWTGVVLVIDDEIKKEIQEIKYSKYWITAFYISPLVLFAVYLFSFENFFSIANYSLSVIGAIICSLIIQHELGMHSVILDKLCPQDSKRVNCDAVLKSKGATFFNRFRFSDIGLVYFASSIISWILITLSKSSTNTIVLLITLATPFTFFSIFYQYKIVKKWCLLCLCVVSILWLQAATLVLIDFNNAFQIISIQSICLVFFSFFSTVVLWHFISKRLYKEKELTEIKIEHFRFKRNYNIYKSLISSKPKINTYIANVNELIFENGSSISPVEIVIISNPLCGFCKEAHQLFERLIEQPNNNVKIIIRFNVSKDSNSTDTKIALKIIDIYRHQGVKHCKNALHDIYIRLKPNEWFDEWGETVEFKETDLLQKTKEWCTKNNLNFTPEILVEGRSFPSEYNRTDLVYFIDELIDEVENAESITSVYSEN